MATTSTSKRTVTGGAGAVPLSASQKRESHKQAKAMQDLGVVPEWSDIAELRQLDFGKYLSRRTRLYDEKKELEDAIKEIDRDLLAALAVSGVDKVLWDSRPVQIVRSKSGDRIVAEKLLLHGVAPSVIQDSTEPGKPYEYLLVGRPGK